MKRFVQLWLVFAGMLIAASSFGFVGERFVEGVHYTRAENGSPQPGAVVEFFSFGCPHCAHLEPGLEQWLATKPDTVVFSRSPVTWSQQYAFLARVWFVLEGAGVQEDGIQKIFNHIHKDKKALNTPQDVAALMATLGVDQARFDALWDGPDMDQKLRGAQENLLRYKVSGVPAFLVAGQYMTSVSQAGSVAELFDVIGYLLAK